MKTNPKDIRRSCGQRVVAPAPSAPQARPLWPPQLPGFWLPFHPPVCVWKSSWPTDSADTSTEHGYITGFILFMIWSLSLICIVKWHTHTHLPCNKDKHVFALIYTIQCHTPQPQTHRQHTCTLIYCSHIPLLEGDDNCGRPINYCCLHINYKNHVWQWGKWDLVTNFMRLGCPAAFLNMLQIAIPYLASVMGSYG